jgi:hypothetical protein
MLRKINARSVILFILLFLPACHASRIPKTIPEGYVPHLREIKERVTGSWVDISIRDSSSTAGNFKYSGELIAIDNDSIFLLTLDKLTSFNINSLAKAKLYIFISPVMVYGVATALVFLPNLMGMLSSGSDYSINFLALGIPWLLTGSISTLIEEANNKNLLEFPGKNKLEEFRKFGRFPMGIPPEVNRNQLHLLIKKTQP